MLNDKIEKVEQDIKSCKEMIDAIVDSLNKMEKQLDLLSKTNNAH